MKNTFNELQGLSNIFVLIPGKILKVKNHSKIKFGKPEISGKASFLKTMETDFKSKHPKY